MKIKPMLHRVAEFFRRLFRRTAAQVQVPALTAPAAVQSQVMKARSKTTSEKRRAALRLVLHRIDGGGKHYASKRAWSNHRGSGKGKRSGRQ